MKALKEKLQRKPRKVYTAYVIVRCVEVGGAVMTANQVAYWELQEQKRHNFEDETIRSNTQRAQEQRFKQQSAIEAKQARTAQQRADTEAKRQAAEKSHWDAQDAVNIVGAVTGVVKTGAGIGAQLAGLFA